MSSYKRAQFNSFGSICYASLVIAIIRTAQYAARVARSESDSTIIRIIACLIECLLNCIGDAIDYLNQWALVQVGVYGLKYCDSANATFELIRERGLEGVIADDLTGIAIYFGAFFAIGACALLGAVGGFFTLASITKSYDADFRLTWIIVGAVLGGFVAYLTASSVLSTLESQIKTFYVCWAKDRGALEKNHPDINQQVIEAYNNVAARRNYPAAQW